MNAIERVLSIALAEEGYLEKAGNSSLYDKTANAGAANYTKYGYEMHKLYPATMDYPAAWCDAFVDWCFVQAFGADMAAKLLHRFDDYTVNSAGYFKNAGEWHKTPKAGDQVFFINSKGGICHTGLVYKVDGIRVYTIEGNTSGASGVIDNGGGVCKKYYPLNYSKIAGYGRPNYKLVESEELSMAQYEELKNMIKELSDRVAKLEKPIYGYVDENMPEWARPTITKLYQKGYLKGDTSGRLNLSEDMLRQLVINDRAGLYDKE